MASLAVKEMRICLGISTSSPGRTKTSCSASDLVKAQSSSMAERTIKSKVASGDRSSYPISVRARAVDATFLP